MARGRSITYVGIASAAIIASGVVTLFSDRAGESEQTQVPEAVIAALSGSFYGEVREVLKVVPATLHTYPGDHLYAALVAGKFTPPMHISPRMLPKSKRASLDWTGDHAAAVFTRQGELVRLGIFRGSYSDNPVWLRIFGPEAASEPWGS